MWKGDQRPPDTDRAIAKEKVTQQGGNYTTLGFSCPGTDEEKSPRNTKGGIEETPGLFTERGDLERKGKIGEGTFGSSIILSSNQMEEKEKGNSKVASVRRSLSSDSKT